MAKIAVSATLGASLGEGNYNTSTGLKPDPVAAAAAAPDSTALAAAMAVLVADGASPTQAHVTTADAALTTFLAAQTVYTAAVQASVAGNLVLLIDTAVLTTSNAIRACIRAALQQAKNLGIVTS